MKIFKTFEIVFNCIIIILLNYCNIEGLQYKGIIFLFKKDQVE